MVRRSLPARVGGMTLSERFARAGYTLALRLLAPAYVARLWWRGRAEPLYRQAWGERFACAAAADDASVDDAPAESPLIWVHAVSLGETRAATALIEVLREQLPGMRLLLTHTTATGREAGAALLRAGDRQVWLPYDLPGATRRFLQRYGPDVGVLMETEVWPNLQISAQMAGVPMVLANARLSEKSLRRGLHLRALMRPAAQSLALALAQTSDDARRLQQAGVPTVQVCGNLKFDVTPKPGLLSLGRRWRAFCTRPVVLAASTREGEDAGLVSAWLAQPQPRPLLMVVPRHPQRFDEVAGLWREAGVVVSRRSDWLLNEPDAQAREADVWVGDSIGEMPAYYAAADVALLGGSFAPLGGQNLIEAAACGCPIVMGPHTFNFAQAAELSVQAGAAQRVSGWHEGVVAARAIATDTSVRQEMTARARDFSQAHRGAAARMAEAILRVRLGGG